MLSVYTIIHTIKKPSNMQIVEKFKLAVKNKNKRLPFVHITVCFIKSDFLILRNVVSDATG